MTTEASRLAPPVKAREVKFIEFSLRSPSFSLSPISSISTRVPFRALEESAQASKCAMDDCLCCSIIPHLG